jgi:hypothetical protein
VTGQHREDGLEAVDVSFDPLGHGRGVVRGVLTGGDVAVPLAA